MNRSSNSNLSLTRTGYTSITRSLNISSPTKPEIVSKNKAHDLRQILKERMVELGTLQSEWSTRETKLRTQADELISQLRDLNSQGISMMQQEDQRHANEIDKMKQQHQLEILELQTQFSDGFSDDDQSHEFEELDHEIASLKDAIAKIENAPPPSGDTDDIDEEAEERLRILEERLDEITLTRDEALQQREEDSKASTQMIEQLIIKNQDDELAFKTEIDQLVDRLSQIDREHSERIDEITHEFQENKKNIASALKNSLSRIAQLQNNFTKKQRAHNKTMIAMHDELDRLKANLESYTTRQKQQMREATYAAKCIIEEKQKFRSFHRELEMLNSELVRESVEHETLMMELNKMDGLILSQMSAVGSRNSSVTYSRNSRF